jgi:MFS transporter, ACS family, tartrate transporter
MDVARSAKRKAYLRVILPLFITSVIAYIDRVNIGYAALTMNKDLGFGPEVFGMGAGIFFAGYVVFEIPGALLAEKYRPRVWLARIMMSWAVICSYMAFMHTATEFYVARFLLGAAEASLYPVIYVSFIPRWFNAADRARAIAVLLTSLQVSGIVGAPAAGWLLGMPMMGLKGWQLLFLIEAMPAAFFGIAILRGAVDDIPKDAKWLTPEERAFVVDQYNREVAAQVATKRYTVLEAMKDREVLKLCLIYFLWITGFWGFNFWMPQVLKSLSGWSNMAIGWLTIIPMSISLLVMLAVGHSSSKTGEKRWHGALGLFVGAFGLGVGSLVTDPLISFGLVIVAAVGVYAAFGVWWSYPTTFLSGPAAAAAVAMINSFGNIGGFVGPYFTGWLKKSTGSFAIAWAYLAFSLTAAGLLMLTLKKKPVPVASVPTSPP